MTADPTNYARYFASPRKSSRIETRGGRILLVRRGALNPMDQTVGCYANRAPERRGFWAFPHPHFDECCVSDVRKFADRGDSALCVAAESRIGSGDGSGGLEIHTPGLTAIETLGTSGYRPFVLTNMTFSVIIVP